MTENSAHALPSADDLPAAGAPTLPTGWRYEVRPVGTGAEVRIRDRRHVGGAARFDESHPRDVEGGVGAARRAYSELESRIRMGRIVLKDPAAGLVPSARIRRSVDRSQVGCLTVLAVVVAMVIASFAIPLALGHDSNWRSHHETCEHWAATYADPAGFDGRSPYENCMRSVGLKP